MSTSLQVEKNQVWTHFAPGGQLGSAGFLFQKSILGNGFRMQLELCVGCFDLCLNGYVRI